MDIVSFVLAVQTVYFRFLIGLLLFSRFGTTLTGMLTGEYRWTEVFAGLCTLPFLLFVVMDLVNFTFIVVDPKSEGDPAKGSAKGPAIFTKLATPVVCLEGIPSQNIASSLVVSIIVYAILDFSWFASMNAFRPFRQPILF